MIHNIGIYFCAMLFILAYPSLKTVPVDFRNLSEPLVIKISQNNPSLAAFFDVQLEIEDSDTFYVESPVSLLAGTKWQGLIQQGPKGLTYEESSAHDIEVLTGEELRVSLASDIPAIYATDGSLLPLKERMRRVEEHFLNEAPTSLASSSWQEKAQELLLAVNNQDITEVDQKIIPSALSGTPILVKRVETPLSTVLPNIPSAREPSTNAVKTGATSDNGQKTKEAELTHNRKDKISFVISGEIELGGGLAYLSGESHLVIYREENGQVVDEGKIWFDQGRYEIVVEDMAGYLIVELQDNKGNILGISEKDLYTWGNIPYAHNKIEGVHYMVEPVRKGIELEVISARPTVGKHQAYKNARVNVEGLGRLLSLKGTNYVDPLIENESTFWVKSGLEKNWATISPVQSQEHFSLRMFPEIYLQTVATSIEEKFDTTKGWLAGKISGAQAAISGAHVEVVGINSEFKAIYFTDSTELIQWPDKSIKTTTSNGMFIVPNLPPGAYSVRVVLGDEILPAESLYIESQSVTYLDLNFGEMKVAGLNIYDPIFNLDRLGATIRVLGSEKEFQVFGSENDRFNFPEGRGTLTIEADAGREYLVSKTQFSRKSRSLRIPVIAEQWFHESLTKKSMAQAADLGLVIGFIEGDDYDVIASSGKTREEDLEVIYFKSDGSLADNDHGIKGGGFIVPNLPEGLAGISIVPHNKKKVLLKSIVSERGYASTFKASLY